MRKYVFYLETNAPVDDNQIFLLDLAAYMADYTDNDIYYINNYFAEELARHPDTGLKYSSPDDFDFSISNDAVFFTPVNYLMHLLVRIKDYPNAKICVYKYAYQAVAWLCNNIGDLGAKVAVANLFKGHNAIAYKHFGCVTPKDPLQLYDGTTFLPSVLNYISSDEPVFLDNTVNDDKINVGFYGVLDLPNINMLYNLFSNLALSRIDKKIDVHIIGKANIVLNTNFKHCSSNTTRVIFTGELDRDTRIEYVRKNVDFLLATKTNAIEASTYGVPVVVPVTSPKPFCGNNYVYLFDICGYRYSFDINEFLECNNTCYKIDRIIDDIYCDRKKSLLAKKCFDYCMNNNSPKKIANDLIDFEANSALYVQDCLKNKSFANCLSQFEIFANNTKSNSFVDYINAQKRASQQIAERK